MGRSTGRFPAHFKLDVDQKKWPANYYDSCRTCEGCGKHWPYTDDFLISPCCGDKTKYNTGDVPDMRWDAAIRELLHSLFDAYYSEWNEGLTDEELVLDKSVKDGRFVDPGKFLRV